MIYNKNGCNRTNHHNGDDGCSEGMGVIPSDVGDAMVLCANCGCYHNRQICPYCDNPEITERALRIIDGKAA